jgi:hypothetical protein
MELTTGSCGVSCASMGGMLGTSGTGSAPRQLARCQVVCANAIASAAELLNIQI